MVMIRLKRCIFAVRFRKINEQRDLFCKAFIYNRVTVKLFNN